jgi:hypothetical protein
MEGFPEGLRGPRAQGGFQGTPGLFFSGSGMQHCREGEGACEGGPHPNAASRMDPEQSRICAVHLRASTSKSAKLAEEA